MNRVARVLCSLCVAWGLSAPARAQAPLPVLDVPYVSQSEALCGGAAAAMVLRFWGERGLTAESFAGLVDRSAAGIRTDALLADLARRGWQAPAVSGTADLLAASLAAGRPALALVEERRGTFHYVVVVAQTPTAVVFHDPARAPFRVLSRAEFDTRWRAAGRWMAVVVPGAGRPAAPPEARSPEAPRLVENGAPDRCADLVAQGVSLAQAGDLAAAERPLTTALSCPGGAAARELAGVRVRQERWADARDLASAAVAADPGDGYAWKTLATARFVQGDRGGALSAWNAAGEPRVDLVRIEGLTRTRAGVVERLIGVEPGQVLTGGLFGRARRRLSELPPATQTSLEYVPLAGGLTELRATVTERSLLPRTPVSQAAIAIAAAFTRSVSVSSGSFFGGGDQLTGEWRFWPGRPRVALDYQAPAPWGGIWGVAGSYEEQPFDRTDVTPVTRRGARLMLADWATSRVRWTVRGGLDHWNATGRVALAGGGLRVTSGGDRFVGQLDLDSWSGDASFGIAQGRLRVRTSVEARGWVATGLVGLGLASARTPGDLWFAGDTGLARPVLLRAHPLVDDGRFRTAQMGRALVHGSFEAQRWWRVPLVAVGGAAFIDAARLDRRVDAGARRDVDVGGGFRATVPGLGGMLRIDLGRGLRDGKTRLSFVYEP